VRVDVTGRLSADAETVLYRVMQEAVTNAGKHAMAANICLSLRASDEGVELVIADDGVGFVAETQTHLLQSGHFGLAGMRERMELVGGTFEVLSTPGAGTTVRAWMPEATARRTEGLSTRNDEREMTVTVAR
jgi:signal transduction histidine kinase